MSLDEGDHHGAGFARRGRESLTTSLVWCVWAALTLIAFVYVARFGSRVLFQDDLTLTQVWGRRGFDLARDLWAPHNEHRIPLPRAISWALYAIDHDVRFTCAASVALLSSIAAAMIVAARRWRGATSIADVFFPLVWLHLGHAENLLMGFQLALILPTALVCAILLISIARARAMSVRDAWISAACLVALPLCGGPGMLQAPILAVWLAAIGGQHVRASTEAARRAGRVLLAGVCVTGLVGLLYLVDFHPTADGVHSNAPALLLGVALRVLALALGVAGGAWWPWSAIFVLGVAAAAVIFAAKTWRSRGDDRWSAAAVVVGMTASVVLALGIGYGRGGTDGSLVQGFANRYVGLPTPFLCMAYFGWLRFAPKRTSTIAHALMSIVILVANVSVNDSYGLDYGAERRAVAVAFEADVARGVGVTDLATRYGDALDANRARFRMELQSEFELGLPPFDTYPAWAAERARWPMFDVAPSQFESAVSTSVRYLDGKDAALMVTDGTRITFDVPPGAQRVIGMCGVIEGAWKAKVCPAIVVEVFEVDADGERVSRYLRRLDPKRVERDREPERFEVELRAAADERARGRGWVQVVFSKGETQEAALPWIWVRGIRFE